ncbi:MAG: hypothetical protein ACI936_000938 [Paraglaciecola sp.]|jgi:hypothetical protein
MDEWMNHRQWTLPLKLQPHQKPYSVLSQRSASGLVSSRTLPFLQHLSKWYLTQFDRYD